MGRELPAACNRARHLGRDLHARDGRPQTGHVGVRRDQQSARVQGKDLAVPQPPRLRLAHPDRQGEAQGARRASGAHRKGCRRLAHGAAGAVGHRVRLRRSRRAAERDASDLPLARRAGVGRSTPPQILGTGADQRAAHRRARLVDPGGDARLLGRRHGPHPMDAGGLAQHGHGLQRRRPRDRRSARPTTRSDRRRAISSAAASGAAASIGATR